MGENFDDMNSLFATEEDKILQDADMLAKGESIDFREKHIFSITNVLESSGPFESISFPAGPYKFKISATKNTGTVPFLDFKVILENPPSAPTKINVTLTITNTVNEKETISATSTSALSKNFAVIYFSNFISLRALNETEGYITNNSLNVDVSFSSVNSDTSLYTNAESRENTGYVGLENQGATCYMNSMLQMLFHIPAFRQIVYQIPTADIEDPEMSIPLQLQMLFYNLEFSQNAVSTKDLTKSFGWRTQDIMTQHDVQEFNRILMSKLEEKLKGTDYEKTINSLFTGKNRSAIRCVNIDYESFTDTSFTDLQLRVQGNSNLEESFDSYLESDRLEGSNQYNVPGHGKQDADICMEITELPTVLQLHLNRFSYDPYKDAIVKVNDWFEYPESIDMSRFVVDCDKELIYDLVGVLVHSGTNYSGHYYAYIKPDIDSDWYEFNDSIVRKAKKDDVFKANFGQPEDDEDEEEVKKPKQVKRFTKRNLRNKMTFDKKKRNVQRRKRTVDHSAYLLVYVSRDKQNEVYGQGKNVPSHLEAIYKKIQEEREEKRKLMLQKVYEADVQYITEDDLKDNESIGFIVKQEKVKRAHVQLQGTIQQLYEIFKEILGNDDFTIWQCGAYGNPTKVLDRENPNPVGKFISGISTLYIQKGKAPEKGEVLIFVKKFDGQNLSYYGFCSFPETKNIKDVCEFANAPQGCDVFVEAYGGRAHSISSDLPLTSNEIHNGVMIVFQTDSKKSDHIEKADNIVEISSVLEKYDVTKFPLYMEMRYASMVLEISSIDNKQQTKIRIPLTIKFVEIKDAISKIFNLEYNPENDSIVLFELNTETSKPKQTPLKTAKKPSVETVFHKSKEGKLFFEVRKGISEEKMLNSLYQRIQISEVASIIQTEIVKILPMNTAVHTIFEDLLKEEIVDGKIDEYRFFTVWGTSIWEILKGNNTLNDDMLSLRIERIPDDEISLDDKEFLIPITHFVDEEKEEIEKFPPALFKVSEGEKASEMKKRMAEFYNVDVSMWHIDAVTTIAGKSKNVTLKNEDTLDSYLKTKSLELQVHHSADRQTNTRNHVSLKIL